MKDKRKILLTVVLAVLVVTLISTLVLSSVYAKYVSEKSGGSTSRPASFELTMKTPKEDEIEVNFAPDGEPGSPIGYTEVYKNYDFSVSTQNSEVASEYMLNITFSGDITKMIKQARADRFADGIWCDFVVFRGVEKKDKDGNVVKDSNDEIVYEYLEANKIVGEESGIDSRLTWKYKVNKVDPNSQPKNEKGEIVTHYRLKMIVYNNTMMPSNGNTLKYVLDSDGIEIEVISKQIDPQYAGTYTVN